MLAIIFAMALLAPAVWQARAEETHRALIIPLEFTDIQLSIPAETIDSLGKELSRYYDSQFGGQKRFVFDVAPTYNVGGKYSVYGANTSYMRDALAYRMALAAYRALFTTIDFALYDNDADTFVNDIIFLTPGMPESSGGGEDQFWPQYTELEEKDIPYSLKYRLKGYAIVSEQNADGSTAGIGLMAHEFGHILGLKDLYDTDAEDSGGLCPGLGITSLMDYGMNNDSGNTPPYLNAIEREMLGNGICETIDSAGIYNLEPIHLNGRYFKLPSTAQKEYYLLENRTAEGNDAHIGGQGMLIYKVNKSDSDAGYSSYFQRTLTALERWNLNQVNSNPDYPCAGLIPAKIDSLDSSAIFWPKEGHTIFSPGRMALTNIRKDAGGNISFNALEPVRIEKVSVFQTSAIITWSTNQELGHVDSCKIEWSRADEVIASANGRNDGNGKYSFIIDGLKPRTNYSFVARAYYSDGASFSASGSFTTKIYRSSIFRFIYMGNVDRHPDGTIVQGASIPLVVYNSVDEEVVWTFNGRRISPGPNGLWSIPWDGVLKAEITTSDGSKDIIIKELHVK